MRRQGNLGFPHYAALAVCAGLTGALISGVFPKTFGNKIIVVALAVLLLMCAMAFLALAVRQAGRR